jgi:hypothetical protein
MKKILLCVLFLVSIKTSICQNGIKSCKDTITVSVELDKGTPVHMDSTKRKIEMVFEQDFNDKISIYLDNIYFKTDSFKTIRNLGVCLNSISIDYSKFKKIPKISVVLDSRNNCVTFYPRIDKKLAYINCIKGGWSVELSNILKDYK